MSGGIAGLSDVVEDEWVVIDGVRYEPRHKVIEECAVAAQEFETHVPGTAWITDEIAAAIRALKDR